MHNGSSIQRFAQKQATELLQELVNAQPDAIDSAIDEDSLKPGRQSNKKRLIAFLAE